ncbi:hypothetical protein J14TS2_07710 [Bacillus sp. J14TS2]|uniref:hypothetical protein n=1 Tax=Bacillus sp. J14TS2 TaxID=2807188 RepID=UPI001B181A00|nr:hypothetical protein [Bacillus sp. J14TS2]GIN70296.1 hypothetical protein J14TS2_07710 [Bacillus sp. J14TS2]
MKTVKKMESTRTFSHSVSAEMSKLWSLPFLWLVLIGALGITIVFACIFTLSSRGSISGEATDAVILGMTPISYIQAGFFIFGVIASCSEYIGGQIRTTFLAIPNRIEQRLAATVALIPITFVSALLVCVTTITVTYILLGNTNTVFDMWLTIRMILNAAIYLLLMTILSSAIGTLVQRSIPIIGGLFLYLFIISPLIVGQPFSFYLPDTASATLWFPTPPEGAPPAIEAWMVVLGWPLIFLIISIIIAKRQDA